MSSAEHRPGFPSGATGACTAGDWMRIGPLTLSCRVVKGRGAWTRTQRGAKYVAAESMAQAVTRVVAGPCHVGSWIRVAGTKLGCTSSAGPRSWTVDGQRGVVANSGVIRTLPPNAWNTLFQLYPQQTSEIGQSLVVDAPTTLTDATIYPIEMTWGDADFWATPVPHDDALSHQTRGPEPIPNTVHVALYRSASSATLPAQVDVSSGFVRVGTGVSTAPTVLGQPYTVRFDTPVSVVPGQYLVVFSFEIPNGSIITLRFQGWQAGTKTTIGAGADGAPSPCVYTPSQDVYPPGRAYQGTGLTFGTAFTYMESKVYECAGVPRGMGVWNQGDLSVQFTATARSTPVEAPGPSAKAPLPASAYAGLACDPFDRRIKGRVLPNGIGPEARAAAACGLLDWLAAGGSNRPITIRTSPGLPVRYTGLMKTAIAAGDRLFGAYGSPQRSYEMLESGSPSWSCSTGADLFAAGTVALSARTDSWGTQINSGCPQGPYRAGVWQAAILGASGDRYFAWSLLTPEDLAKNAADELFSPTWSLRFLGHEYAHDIQRQRAAQHSNPAINGDGHLESPGSWFVEGQAQYLGYQAGSLSSMTPDMRQHMIDSLSELMGRYNIPRISMTDVASRGDMDLIYATGYFAYEYLLAHYGPTVLWGSWDIWNSTPCSTPASDTCWRGHSEQVFGTDADELLRAVDAYVNAQGTQS